MEKYTDYEMCKKCGGACCKENGCIYLPKDFDNLEFDYLKKILEKGNISISGQPFPIFNNKAWSFIPYLRARNKDAEIVDLITSGGPCKLLTKTGCALKENQRPSLGLSVRPIIIGGPCKQECEIKEAMHWLDYSEVLSELVKYYTNKELIDVIIDQIINQMTSIPKKIKKLQELKEMEKVMINWYKKIMAEKPYYSPEEIKQMRLY